MVRYERQRWGAVSRVRRRLLSRSIFRDAWIDLVGPGEDAAFEIENFAEAGFAEKIDGFRGAFAAAAMGHDFA